MSNLLNIGRTGLMASKKSLETTGHNIANVNTKGFSRQRVDLQTNTPIAKNGIISGTGVNINGINRVHDQFIEKKLNGDISNHEYYTSRHNKLTEIENIFNELESGGLNKVLNNFYNSFRDLANQPENETVRSVVRDSAGLVTKDFRRIRLALDDISEKIDLKLENSVKGINQSVDQIAYLNKKISQIEVIGGETGDLRDQRDSVISGLAEEFKIHTYETNNGQYVVHAVNVGTLVTGTTAQHLSIGRTPKEDSSNNMNASVDIYFKNRSSHKITTKFQSGHFASLIRARNDDIQTLQKSTDKIAFELVNSVNAVHRRGFVNREIETDNEGNAVGEDRRGPTTGVNFFEQVDKVDGAALALDLSSLVKEDLSNIATALGPNSPGDNRIAIGISKLQHEKVMGDGTDTIEEFYLKNIGRVGLETGKAQFDSQQMEGIKNQTKSMKESTSGVSIDEEAANMVKFQHAYEASAKMMKTAEEMFQTVLSIKR